MATNLSADAISWREKYLEALDAQEQVERDAQQQQRSLRRALVQLSLLVDGQDSALDNFLDQLRAALRNEAEAVPDHLLTQLDQTVRAADGQQDQFDADVLRELTRLASGLRSLGLTGGLKRELDHYLTRLPARAQKIGLYPALLDQLAELQERALEELRAPRPGLFQRLRGASAAPQFASEGLLEELGEVLQRLLDAVDTEYVAPESLQELRERITSDVLLNDLPAILAQSRDLLKQAWLAANEVFAQYLDQVNAELAEIAGVLGGAVAQETARNSAQSDFQNALEMNCQSLEGQVVDARDLQQLKQQVSTQLSQIRSALADFRAAERQDEGLVGQLTTLAERVALMERDAEANRAKLKEQRHKALHDPLTQLPNREAYEERVRHETQRWQRYGHPLSLAVCDIDHFKQINDRFGHQAGDRVLKVLSQAIEKRLREVDFIGRFGGEEFIILMPETGAAEAHKALDAIRDAIASTSFHYRKEPLTVTLCMGVAEFQQGDTPEKVFGRADRALYEAKAAGRNRTCLG
ncbi:diguanylate cyclase [Marinimicrobium sp. ABcell2]|uniref:GGDEF domain-containing protein n=1 Tax=Marinimicrobium sp. ABcell2 TaxID=3069751 RepID=UPI0027B62F7C|nr:GGDEF domain-containing protein [Marinimicrobium sp. ABcell2]MDQ2076222.1 diguanylate cyclase [Marinimicrobium sp. ABcell2]